jgi:hypothetical protein
MSFWILLSRILSNIHWNESNFIGRGEASQTHGKQGKYSGCKDRAVLKPPSFYLLVCVVVPSPHVQADWYHCQHRC